MLQVALVSTILLSIGIFQVALTRIFDLAPSAAPGTLFSISIIFLLLRKYSKDLYKIKKRTLYIIIFIILYSMLQFYLVDYFNLKTYLSFPLFIYLCIVTYMMSVFLSKIDIKKLYASIDLSVYVIIFFGILTILSEGRFGIPFGYNYREVFPFAEPSHYALFSGPFFILYFISSPNIIRRIFILTVTLLFAIYIQSLTMLIFNILLWGLLIKPSVKNILILLAMLYFFLSVIFNIEYFNKRINLDSEESNNLSTLVYLQGFYDAKYSLVHSNGLGLGFQMMGTQAESEIGELIRTFYKNIHDGINREDGGFLAAKIVAEFGIFGIVLLFMYIYLLIKSYIILQKRSTIEDKVLVFSSGLIYSSFVYFFIRGIGYFSPSIIFFLVGFFYIFQYRYKKI